MLVLLIHLFRFFRKYSLLLYSLLLLTTIILVYFLFNFPIPGGSFPSFPWSGEIHNDYKAYRGLFILIFPLILSLVFTYLLLKNLRNAFISILPFVFGTLAAIAVFNILNLSISFFAFLLGIAMIALSFNYSLYFFNRLRLIATVDDALRESIISVTQRSLAAAAFFFSLMLVKSDLMYQLGLFAGSGILGSALFLFLFLPHLINKKPGKQNSKVNKSIFEVIARYSFDKDVILKIFILLLSFWFLFGINGIVYDTHKISLEFNSSVQSDFGFIVHICLILLPLFMIFYFGRIELGLIASLPVFGAWLWTLGFTGISGFSVNENGLLIPVIIFGIGAEYSILLMRALILDFKTVGDEFGKAKTIVIFSLILLLVFFGALSLVNGSDFLKLTLVSAVGLLSSALISFALIPAFFRYLVIIRGKNRRVPMTFLDFVLTVLSFTIFLSGCLTMNLFLPLMYILPLRKASKKTIMHYLMMGFCRFEVYLMFTVKKRILYEGYEDFHKPALIIANHQSHIDLLLILMLTPKLIVITNNWVWNNPVYSLVIRYLDFYTVSEGYETIMDKLRAKVNEGYSILIFPEGSRSEDSKITRFHKGAFVIAEQLNLDIVPVIIYGVGDCMNKGENFLKTGTITMKIHKRILPSDHSYGEDYSARSKSILKFCRAEYAVMEEEFGTPSYYRNKLLRNYYYKGPVLEWYMRVKTKLESNYEFFNTMLPRNAKIVDMGCGYGFLSYMLGFVSRQRTVTGVDYDKGKIDVANNCISKNENINFVHSDVLTFELSMSDAFIINDVLHYFCQEKQKDLIERCIANLNENGLIIIREADMKLKARQKFTLFSELFSSLVGFNIRSADTYYFTDAQQFEDIAKNHNMQLQVFDNSLLTSNLTYVMKK